MATIVEPKAALMGASIKRLEDGKFLTGRGSYTDDIKLTGQTHAVFVRSPHAHATIRGIDAKTALGMPGVHAVLTGDDLKSSGVNPMPVGWLIPDIKIGEKHALAVGTARFVGEAVAVVVADTPALARDAADAVVVDYDVLPAAVEAVDALKPGAPQVHANAPGNVVFNWQIGDKAKTDAAFASAKTIVRQRLVNQRLIANALEPRASAAAFNPANDELTLYVTSQNPHVHRLIMGAFILGLPEHKFRVISPDVGGGFGSKISCIPKNASSRGRPNVSRVRYAGRRRAAKAL